MASRRKTARGRSSACALSARSEAWSSSHARANRGRRRSRSPRGRRARAPGGDRLLPPGRGGPAVARRRALAPEARRRRSRRARASRTPARHPTPGGAAPAPRGSGGRSPPVRRVRSKAVREVLAQLEGWLAKGERAALATVIETRRSAPRPLGSRLAVSESGLLFGSVSGGCVESDVAVQAREVIAGGEPRVLPYGIADEDARSVGLPCGGEIDVFVAPVSDAELVGRLRQAVEEGVRGRLTTVVEGRRAARWCSSSTGRRRPTDRRSSRRTDGQCSSSRSRRRRSSSRSARSTSPRCCVAGHAARLAGAVADPRRALLTAERLPSAGALIDGWPEDALARAGTDDQTAVVILAHDEKIDIPALSWALRSDAFYVGALGSRRTQAKRRERLEEEGLTEAQLARLSGPAGLDLGGETLEETALSILAEIVAVRHGQGEAASARRRRPSTPKRASAPAASSPGAPRRSRRCPC